MYHRIGIASIHHCLQICAMNEIFCITMSRGCDFSLLDQSGDGGEMKCPRTAQVHVDVDVVLVCLR